MKLKLFVLACLSVFFGCQSGSIETGVPEKFAEFLSRTVVQVKYLKTEAFHGENRHLMPDSLTKSEALQDIEMLEYLLSTSYSGYEYWQKEGVDFGAYFGHLHSFVQENLSVDTKSFEKEISGILTQLRDGHISFVGEGYHGAYRHKAVYFCDVLIEKTTGGRYQVINSKNKSVDTGWFFTEPEPETFLFRTLSAPGKDQFLLGVFSYEMVNRKNLSFDDHVLEVPFRKSRLLNARFEDKSQFYITRKNDIPAIRVTGFGDELYPIMKDFMHAGTELRNEKVILVNLFNNGGGSSVFPQTFIKNLNGSVQWETYWAELTSPAIAEYYANMDLSERLEVSPALQQLKARYSNKFEQLKRTPVKSWTFSETEMKPVRGKFAGKMILLTNRRVLSAGENMVGSSRSIPDQIIIGENTGGSAQFSSTCEYVLPHSRLVLKLPRQLIFIPGLEECVGYLPDYWLDTQDPVEEVMSWLKDPNHYQFQYPNSYAEMLETMTPSIVLPEDVKIARPSLEIAEAQTQFSGKWFGVSDGILDHMLVVEKITNSSDVDAIYAWGVAYQWGINQPGWERFKGVFEDGKLILGRADGSQTITYWINPDGNMSSVYERPGIYSRSELTKLE
ncbi:MAG: hypothetical protein HQ556_00900 [Candidatus Marinimicrobia bacterium]|nr:hypothetical protein [Candidatus Neomarinimicrobiota bacterium]